MTKFKVNMQEMQSLQKYTDFQEYLINNTTDIIFGSLSDILAKDLEREPTIGHGWNPFNSTTPNPLDGRLESESDHHSG